MAYLIKFLKKKEYAANNMKILNIVSKGYPHGGAEKIIQDINVSLTAKGYEVRTLASDLERYA